MLKKTLALLLASLLVALLSGCSTQTPVFENDKSAVSNDTKYTVTVVVTRDFGKELIL